MGLCAIPLWALGIFRPRLGLGAGTSDGTSRVRTRTRRIRRRSWFQHCRVVGPRNRLVSARTTRRLSAAVSRQQQLLPASERQQHGDQPGQYHQRVQRLPDEYERHADQLREHARAECGDGGAAGSLRAIAERPSRCGCVARCGDRVGAGADGCTRCTGSDRVRWCCERCEGEAARSRRAACGCRARGAATAAGSSCAEDAGAREESWPAIVAA